MNPAHEAALSGGVVIIGAGQAGARAAEALRAEGFTGTVTLVGDELERPYERPSLSKEMLLDGTREAITWVHPPEFYADNAIDLRLGVSASGIDRAARRVTLSDGTVIGYGVLLLATGASARSLPTSDTNSACFTLRSIEDSRALRARLIAGQRIVVIGAGFIGLEVAAAAIMRGCTVTVIETGPAPLGRVAPPLLQDYYRELHVARGVSFRFGMQVHSVSEQDGISLVELANGETLPADLVVVGIGAVPNDRLADTAGLTCSNGVVVDRFGATDDPYIFAAGDVARHDNPHIGRHVLLESWQNAQDQAMAIARNIARPQSPEPYAALPWFWSDQYDINLQIFGLAEADAVTVVRGDRAASSWLMAQLRGDRIIFAAGINAARDLRPLRELMKLGLPVRADDLANTKIPLPELLRSARTAAAAA